MDSGTWAKRKDALNPENCNDERRGMEWKMDLSACAGECRVTTSLLFDASIDGALKAESLSVGMEIESRRIWLARSGESERVR